MFSDAMTLPSSLVRAAPPLTCSSGDPPTADFIKSMVGNYRTFYQMHLPQILWKPGQIAVLPTADLLLTAAVSDRRFDDARRFRERV